MAQSHFQLSGIRKHKSRTCEQSTLKNASLDPKIGFIFANCQIHQTAVFMLHQPTKVTTTTSIVKQRDQLSLNKFMNHSTFVVSNVKSILANLLV